jgi:hypothetical protein
MRSSTVVIKLLSSLRLARVGISGSCASMRNAPDLRIQGTFFTLIVSRGILALSPFIS